MPCCFLLQSACGERQRREILITRAQLEVGRGQEIFQSANLAGGAGHQVLVPLQLLTALETLGQFHAQAHIGQVFGLNFMGALIMATAHRLLLRTGQHDLEDEGCGRREGEKKREDGDEINAAGQATFKLPAANWLRKETDIDVGRQAVGTNAVAVGAGPTLGNWVQTTVAGGARSFIQDHLFKDEREIGWR